MKHRSEYDNDLSCLTDPRGHSECLAHDLVIRRSQAVTCRTSGTIVEIILEIPDSNPNIMQTGRVSDAVQAGVRQ